MFNMKKDYANWNKGVDVPVFNNQVDFLTFINIFELLVQFVGVPQKEDPAVHDKLRARFEAMERRGHLGQKLGGSQQQLGNYKTKFELIFS